MILVPADEAIYFPNIGIEGDALDGCLKRTQAFVESHLGCGRPIEPNLYVENYQVPQQSWVTTPRDLARTSILHTRHFPLILGVVPILEARTGDTFGRGITDWATISPSSFEIDPAGRLRVNIACTEVRFTYTAGIDFTKDDDPAVVEIKAIAGMIAIRLSARADIESRRTNNESYLYENFTDYIRTVLQPLKRYAPRNYG